MHDLVQFHKHHGSSVLLTENGSVATRDQADFGNGIAFSSKPVKLGQKVCVEVTAASQWSGAVRIGISTHDPGKMAASGVPLPRFACPELTNKEGYWARAIAEEYAETGNRITFYVNAAGQMHYFVNNEHKGVLLNCLPTSCNLWVLFDIYGNTVTAKLVPPTEAPVEILARGTDALRAYHTACESGTQAVFRTRLMLVGQDRVGKTSLKNALTGQSHNEEEQSTDGIDLSASCSFNLRDRRAWTLAMKGSDSQKEDGRLLMAPTAASLEEEYHQAIAHNIVHQLLFNQKKQLDVESKTTSSALSSTSSFSSAASLVKRSITSATGSGGGGSGQSYKDKPYSDDDDWDESSVETLQLQDLDDCEAEPVARKRKDTSVTSKGDRGVKATPSSGGSGPRSRSGSGSQSTGLVAPPPSPDLRHHELLQEVPDRVVDLVQQLMAERNTNKNRAKSEAATPSGKNIVLNIWDFAGQAVYYTTHQVFLSSRAVYIIVFDLQHDLYEQACNAESYSELTNIGYMDFWMHSIHAHAGQNTRNSVDNTTLSPPIFIVGTHRASLGPDNETQQAKAEEKFDQVRKFIVGKPYERHIVPTYYAVENSMEDVTKDEQVVSLQRHVEEIASREPYMGEQMPIKWLRMEHAIQERVDVGTPYSTVEQIREVAHEHTITTDQEFHTVLTLYHDLGVIVHFGGSATLDAGLRSTVILQPQWLVDMFKHIISTSDHRIQQSYSDYWHRLDSTGILEEALLDHVWKDVIRQKTVLLGLMEKFDLLCERQPNNASSTVGQSYFVPSCVKPQTPPTPPLYTPAPTDVTFYINFTGFLPDGLYQRMVTRAVRWSQDAGGHEPQLAYRSACLFLDSQHDFLLQMEPLTLARIKVTILRVVNLESGDSSSSDEAIVQPMPPPTQAACAKVRNFLESTLTDLREMWMKRISYHTCVQCFCELPCGLHNQPRCSQPECLHFLNLDECVANKIVCCGHRRVRTHIYRKWFPAPAPISKVGPIFSDSLILSVEDTLGNIEATKGPDLPSWVKGAAKLLNGGIDEQDWIALAKKLGYKKAKIDKFNDDLNPALALLADWIVSSGNTSLSVDMLVTYLEHMNRDDIVEVIQRGQEGDLEPPQVFISYQWDLQDEVNQLRDRLEKAGFTCWMDIGQMGGGDQLYNRIDEGMRNAKVVIACISPKYVASHYCNRELSLADLLRKPILPVMYETVAWPPQGGMALMLAQLVYIDMKGVGGHGGSGIHADIEDKHQEIIQRLLCHVTPAAPPPLILQNSPRTARTEIHDDLLHDADATSSARSLNSRGGSIDHFNHGTTGGGGGGGGYGSDYSQPQVYVAIGGGGHRGGGGGQLSSGSGQRNELPPNQVEQVHVNKCVVCIIL